MAAVVVAFSTVSFAQTANHSHEPAPGGSTTGVAAKSPTDQAFDRLKALAGSWQGKVITTPSAPEVDRKTADISFRVASMGHTLMHEMSIEGRPDHPVTMLVVDSGRLLLTHYCDADNRPRMIGSVSPDGKTVTFEFVDISGNLQFGHMHRAVFTLLDADHHIEEWTFMSPDDKAVTVRLDLRRTIGPKSSAN
jgi:hypothetical protein